MKRLSKCFPLSISNANVQGKQMSPAWASGSKSCNLLIQSGLIIPSSTGMFHVMPLMLRSMNKLESIIDKQMEKMNAQKLQLSSLGSKKLWSATNRWKYFGDELIKTKIDGQEYCLCPTHEEAICGIMAKYMKQVSYAHLPICLYQTTTKYRREHRPHSGLLRCREFTMNDLYTFDADDKSAMETYQEVCQIYDSLFNKLDVEVIKASAATGVIGGHLSHEFHILSNVGEDSITICQETGKAWNSENFVDEMPTNAESLKRVKGIEVGHTFLLGDHYSKMLNATYVDKNFRNIPLEMGCYGIGVSRLIAACLEVLSTNQGMRWPDAIAPYKVCILPPKAGSVEEKCAVDIGRLYDSLQEIPSLSGNVIIDDRTKRTIGWRQAQAQLIGYPVLVIIGKKVLEADPMIELIYQGKETTMEFVPLKSVADRIKHRFEVNI